MGERCKVPHRGLGRSPEANAFCVVKAPKTTFKKAGLSNSSYIVYTCAMHAIYLVVVTAKVPVYSVRNFKM